LTKEHGNKLTPRRKALCSFVGLVLVDQVMKLQGERT